MSQVGEAFVRVRPDTSSFRGDLNRGVKGAFSGVGKIVSAGVIGAAAVGIGAIGVTLHAGVKEWVESTKAATQTEAVLKSTGGVANVTAKEVDNLATSIMRKTGIDDENIKAGENWLLTFKQVRNEAGAGNDIFTQATKTMADLATAQARAHGGVVDLSSASNLLGKALNDPIKGLTALTRVGVTFTEAQKEQIKALVKSGETMQAQKVILAEINSQVGGSAEAFGKTLPGQINILRESFNNMAGTLVGAAAPALTAVTSALSGFVAKLDDAKGAHAKLQVVFDGLKNLAGSAFDGLKAAFNAIDWSKLWDGIKFNAQKIVDKIQAELKAANWEAVGRGIGVSLIAVLNFGKELGQKMTTELVKAVLNINWKDVAAGIVQGLAGEGSLSQKFRNVITKSLDLNPMTKIPIASGEMLRNKIVEGFTAGSMESQIKEKIAANLKTATKNAATSVVPSASAASTQIGSAIMAGAAMGAIANYIALANALVASVLAAIGAAGGRLKGSGDFMFTKQAIGKPMAQGVIDGFRGSISGLAGAVTGSLQTAATASLSGIASLQARIDAITKAREDSDAAAAVRDAAKALADAKKKGEGVLAAQRALDQAKEAIVLTGLNRQLTIEQAAYDKQKAAAEKAAAARLATVQRSMDRAKAIASAAADRVASAWSAVQDKILGAFDIITGAFKAPARQELDLIAARRRQEDMALAVASAEKTLDEARKAGDPDAITTAERALARAREDITIGSLELQAAEQEKAWAEQRAGERTQLETALANLGTHLGKVGAAWNTGLADITKIMDSFGIPFADAGSRLGEAFAAALRAKMEAAATAARNLLGGAAGPRPDNKSGPLGANPLASMKISTPALAGVAIVGGGGALNISASPVEVEMLAELRRQTAALEGEKPVNFSVRDWRGQQVDSNEIALEASR